MCLQQKKRQKKEKTTYIEKNCSAQEQYFANEGNATCPGAALSEMQVISLHISPLLIWNTVIYYASLHAKKRCNDARLCKRDECVVTCQFHTGYHSSVSHGNTCFVIVRGDVQELLLAFRLFCSSIVDPFEIVALKWPRQFCVFGCSAGLVTVLIVPLPKKKIKGVNKHSTLSVPSAD